MEVLNFLVGVSGAFWLLVGISTHAKWVQSVFSQESGKIAQQTQLIKEFGYGAVSQRSQLVAKKGVVYGYWDSSNEQTKPETLPDQRQSPTIFKLVNISLVTGTSIVVLIILGKGLFASIGML